MLKEYERIACTEALAVYNLLEEDVKNLVPKEYVTYMMEHASEDIYVNINPMIPLDMQPISKEGWNLIKKMGMHV